MKNREIQFGSLTILGKLLTVGGVLYGFSLGDTWGKLLKMINKKSSKIKLI